MISCGKHGLFLRKTSSFPEENMVFSGAKHHDKRRKTAMKKPLKDETLGRFF